MRPAAVAVLALLLWPATPAAAELPALARGVNLSHWFEHEASAVVSAEELDELAGAGFDHVRLPVDPGHLGWRPDDPSFDLSTLDAAVRRIVASGLVLVLDLHPSGSLKERIEATPSAQRAVIELWRELAGHYGRLEPDQLVFELFNEPQFYGRAEAWNDFQRRLVSAVRQVAPEHLLIATFPRGGGIDGMEETKPLDDSRLAYSFHFYEPYLITHQGAPWWRGKPASVRHLTGLDYPAARVDFGRLGLDADGGRLGAMLDVAGYIAADWGPERVAARIESARAWGERHGVRLLCTEFGAIDGRLDPASRQRWLSDVRRALEAAGIGWTVWDFGADFAISKGLPGRRRIEPGILMALEMNDDAGRE